MSQRIIKRLENLLKIDGYYNTYLDNVKLYKMSEISSRYNAIFNEWILFCFQGVKNIKVGEDFIDYKVNRYFMASVTLPIECETIASNDEPFLGMIIAFDLTIILDIVNHIEKMENKLDPNIFSSLYSHDITPRLEEALYRLVLILDSKEECDILGESLLKEIYYIILRSSNNEFLNQLLKKDSIERKITNIVRFLHNNLKEEYSMETLALNEGMSISSFHEHFKKVTGFSPYQYIKMMRLTKARDLILKDVKTISEISYEVGYKNPAHFSKEFKSYYGHSPKESKALFKEYSL